MGHCRALVQRGSEVLVEGHRALHRLMERIEPWLTNHSQLWFRDYFVTGASAGSAARQCVMGFVCFDVQKVPET
jgi:hypothetical protein